MKDAEGWVAIGKRVQDVAAQHGCEMWFVEAILNPSPENPRFVRLLYMIGATTRVANVLSLSQDFALAIGEKDVRVKRDGDRISVEITRDAPYSVDFFATMKRLSLKPYQFYLGRGFGGEDLIANMASPEACHVLIAGITGCGKTTLAQTMITSMCAFTRWRDLQIIALDLKRDDRFTKVVAEHVHTHAQTLPEIRAALGEIGSMIQRGVKPSCRVLVYCDEVNEVVEQGGRDVITGLQSIANMGRGLGFSLLLCGQHSKATQLPPPVKANMPLRIAGRVGSAQEAANVSGVRQVGAERLGGKGDFVAVWGGREERFQAPAFTPPPRKTRPPTIVSPWSVRQEAPTFVYPAITQAPKTGGQEARIVKLADDIAEVLRTSPDPDLLSNNAISVRVRGKPVIGSSYHRDFTEALRRARERK